ncbi:hypothetical protein AB0C12_42625 [Actinoplanes sp. NPDC048967]|uniref:hypothetical protein n=1 Tax=Actinoplanes sp. NPDC048967 TaxID=3155269 RepID=UPI0033E5232F
MTAAAPRGEGPVDRYLDDMFDLLAGTGADGRRLLIEPAAEGRARGLDAETAEREAVVRFGAAATVARRVPAGTGIILTWYGLSGDHEVSRSVR